MIWKKKNDVKYQSQINWRRKNLFIRKIIYIMNKKLENLVDLIFTKLKEYKSKEISIEKEELKKFIISLLKER